MIAFLSHLQTALLFVVPLLFLYILGALGIFIFFGKRVSLWRHGAFYVFLTLLAIVLFATLGSYIRLVFFNVHISPNFIPFSYLSEALRRGVVNIVVVQWLSNILLFVPLGFILPVVFHFFRSFLKFFCCIFVFVLAIECLQFFIGRVADVNDLIANVSGGVFGYVGYLFLARCFKKWEWWKKMNGGPEEGSALLGTDTSVGVE